MSEIWLPFRIRSALDPRERARGLIGRRGLGVDEGLWISPCKQVHTFRMRFPIDVAFLGRDDELLHVVHGMTPRRVSKVVWRATGALELPAGTLRGLAVRLGDVISWPQES